MNTHQILRSDYLEILFDGRNKLYGGYVLRSRYAGRLRTAAITGITIATAAVAIPLFLRMLNGADAEIAVPYTQDREITPISDRTVVRPLLPEKPVVQPGSKVASITYTPPVVVKDDLAPDDALPPAQEDIADKAISTVTVDGDPGETVSLAPGPGSGGTEVVEAAPVAPVIHDFVEQMPQFTGGDLNRYLSEHIRYPEPAKENRIQGRTILRFVVNEDGSVSGITLVRAIGGGCDEEAMRVLKHMPKWKPGKLNGRAVKVWFTLPVNFRLE